MLSLKEKISLLLIIAIFPLKWIFVLNYLQIIMWVLIPNFLFDWYLVIGYVIGKVLYYNLVFWIEDNKTIFKEIYGL